MWLAAGKGSMVLVEATGDDAEQALAAIAQLVAEKFGEAE
jgi:phosphotransferase system HPr-like phosphotransfer protein